MKTIGIDCRLYSPSHTGIGRYVAEFLKELAELNPSLKCKLFFGPEQFKDYTLPHEHWEKYLADIPVYSWKEHFQWKRQLMSHTDVDLWYFPHFNVPYGFKKPYVVTIHDLTLHFYPSKNYSPKPSLRQWFKVWVYKKIMNSCVDHAKHVIAISDNTREDLIKHTPVSSHKISTILEGVPERFRNSSTDQLKNTKAYFGIDKPYLLYVGVWRSHKNLLRLLEAFKKVQQQLPYLTLVLAGKADPNYPEIPQTIERLSLQSKVICTGFIEDDQLQDLYTGALAFVFPSLYEGFGLPPLEAMQFSLPVICSKNTSLPQVCGDAVEYFDPTDTDDMVRALLRVLCDEEYQNELRKKGKKNLERFSWRVMTQEIHSIFMRVL